jgi:hypothetical protein
MTTEFDANLIYHSVIRQNVLQIAYNDGRNIPIADFVYPLDSGKFVINWILRKPEIPGYY